MLGLFGNKQQKAEKINKEGLNLARSGDWQSGLNKFLEAIKIDPEFSSAYGNAGNCYRYMNQYDKALEFYQQALELDDEYWDMYYNIPLVYVDMKQYDQAVSGLEDLLSSGHAKQLGNEAEVEILITKYRLRSVIEQLKQDNAPIAPSAEEAGQEKAFHDEAIALFRQGKNQEALSVANQAIQLNDHNADTLTTRAGILLALGMNDDAVHDIFRALRINPTQPYALGNRAALYFKVDDFTAALADYNAVLQIVPDNADYYSSRAWTYNRLDRTEDALRDYETALRLNPNSAIVHYRYGVVLNRIKRYLEAIEAYTRAFQLDTTMNAVLPARALAYATQRRFQEGVADLELYIRRGGGAEMSLDAAQSYLQAMKKSL